MGKIRGEIGGEITGTVGDVTITTSFPKILPIWVDSFRLFSVLQAICAPFRQLYFTEARNRHSNEEVS
jgi:hypothetical protein